MTSQTHTDSDVAVVTRPKTKNPKMHNVVFHNDNKTTFEFVMFVLMTIFHKDLNAAYNITTYIHENGRAVVGTYPASIAETKADDTKAEANKQGFPLQVSTEEAE